ncbi:MAG: hypothetical protein WA175_03530 [Candidatus Acidiferrales bacterium]
MSKLIGLVFVAMLLFPSANPVHEKFAKYKAVEAYEIRPGVLMMPSYSSDGQVCEIGLEKLHYSPETIRLGSSLPRKEIDQIFDELVPPHERGPQSKDSMGTLLTQPGDILATYIDFQNVSIQIYGDVSPAAGKGATNVDEVVAATLIWKGRKCQ